MEEATRKAVERQEEIDELQAEHDLELTPRILSHTFTSLWPNQTVSRLFSLITQLDAAVTGLSGMLAAATPTPPSTDVCDEAKKQKFQALVVEESDLYRSSVTSTLPTVLAASWLPQARDRRSRQDTGWRRRTFHT